MGFIRANAVVASLLLCGAANAMQVKWTLTDVFFENGSRLTGSFVFDSAAPDNPVFLDGAYFNIPQYYSDVDLSVTGTVSYFDCSQQPACIGQSSSDLLVLDEASGAFFLNLEMGFPDLRGRTGVVQVNGSVYSDATWPGYVYQPFSGKLVGAVVPIPAAVWMFGSGLVALFVMARRRLL